MAYVDGLRVAYFDDLRRQHGAYSEGVTGCEYPLFIQPLMAGELARVYHMVVHRRM